jgi:pSer/pThr/pTyr-binding forkhead associated (FHA) protein
MKLFDFLNSEKGSATEVLHNVSATEQLDTATVPLAGTPRLPEEDTIRAYLTDKDDNVYMIGHFPFVIGRKPGSEGTDLSLPHIAEISGIHAAILYEDGCYYICDQNSTNGTFMNRDGCEPFSGVCRVRKEEISDGDVFFLYRTEFTFHLDCSSSQTCIITSQNAATVMLGDDEEDLSDYDAYLETDSGMIPIYGNSFSSDGLSIERSCLEKQAWYIISAGGDIILEGEKLSAGERTELFSGCRFLMNNRVFRFYIR